jgi:hypothetical protein
MPRNSSTSHTKNANPDVLEEARHVRSLERWVFWLRASLALAVTASGIYLLVEGRSEGALVALGGLVLQLVKIERVKRG